MTEEQTNKPATHAASKPNAAKQAVGGFKDANHFKSTLYTKYQKQVENFFQRDEDRALRFLSSVVRSVESTPELLNCEPDSLMTAFLSCAEYRLYPSSVSGEAYVIPYKGKAQFQLGYQGIITLLYRAGVEAVRSDLVYENDEFEYEAGLEPKLVHKPVLFENRGKPIAVYAVAVVNGQNLFKVMTENDVMQYKGFSQSKESQYSPWKPENDPELWMWRKTCIKQLAKSLPKNDDFHRAVAKENEDSTIAMNQRNANGPATTPASHVPELTGEGNNDNEYEQSQSGGNE